MAEELMTIPLSDLRRSAANVRKTDAKRGLEELAASIAAHGLLQSLTVRPLGTNGKKPVGDYEVVAAGGVIVRDLFRTDDDGYFTDSHLLDRMVAEKLAIAAAMEGTG